MDPSEEAVEGMHVEPEGLEAPPAAPLAASAASPTEHAQLVQRLQEHMAAHGLSQMHVFKAANLSSCGQVCMWLGRTRDRLSAATEAETDARIAAYLNNSESMPGRKQRGPHDILASASASSSSSASASASASISASASASASTTTFCGPKKGVGVSGEKREGGFFWKSLSPN